jgi:hypothetical protein
VAAASFLFTVYARLPTSPSHVIFLSFRTVAHRGAGLVGLVKMGNSDQVPTVGGGERVGCLGLIVMGMQPPTTRHAGRGAAVSSGSGALAAHFCRPANGVVSSGRRRF